jgi:hypothetical protein
MRTILIDHECLSVFYPFHLPREDEDHTDRSWVLVGVLSVQSQVFSTVHGSRRRREKGCDWLALCTKTKEERMWLMCWKTCD